MEPVEKIVDEMADEDIKKGSRNEEQEDFEQRWPLSYE